MQVLENYLLLSYHSCYSLTENYSCLLKKKACTACNLLKILLTTID